MTDITTAREELQAQRDALMVGTYVNRFPSTPGEGCLVYRRTRTGEVVRGVDRTLSRRALAWATGCLGFSLVVLSPSVGDDDDEAWLHDARLFIAAQRLNDSGGLTASQAIAILDEALLVLKDYEAGLSDG